MFRWGIVVACCCSNANAFVSHNTYHGEALLQQGPTIGRATTTATTNNAFPLVLQSSVILGQPGEATSSTTPFRFPRVSKNHRDTKKLPDVAIDRASSSSSAAPGSADSCSSFSSTLKLWKHRLVTKEDALHLHKITGVLFLLASWGLSGYAIRDMFSNGWTKPVARHGKPFVALLYTLLTSSVAQSCSSIRLACIHRRGQPAVRNTFLCNAAVAILGSASAVWSSPWYPACLNGSFSKAFYFIMDGIGLIGMADNMIRLKDLVASRQELSVDKKDVDRLGRLQFWKDAFIYMMPILIGAPFFVGIGWQFGIRYDRAFYLNLLKRPGHPHLQTGAVYGMVMVAMGASYSSLVVTLRDKRLIRKQTEGLCLTILMMCLIGSLYQAMRDPGTIAMILGF
jgi:hypothetical protein